MLSITQPTPSSQSRLLALVLAITSSACAFAQAAQPRVVVFQQPGFPTVASVPLSPSALQQDFPGAEVANLATLQTDAALERASLLVLPYGSAFPADAWPSIMHYVEGGGNLLLMGGEPLRVPVRMQPDGTFVQGPAQGSYSRFLDYRHSYALPPAATATTFHWKHGYAFLPEVKLQPREVFAQEGRLDGLGYLDAPDGTHTAAPVIVSTLSSAGGASGGGRIVAMPFRPADGYWETPDGERLLKAAARYAAAGSTSLSLEVQYSAVRPDEPVQLTAHLRRGKGATAAGSLAVEVRLGETVVAQLTVPMQAAQGHVELPFRKVLPAGVYVVSASWTPAGLDAPQEFTENGFVVESAAALQSGDALGVHGDFLSLGGRPFFPVGSNYFTTEENGWDFSGPRNAAVWERDFADMERHHVNFVRTGVWMNPARFLEQATGAANERMLRNLEAYLSAAHRHGIAVNFTFFAFAPKTSEPRTGDGAEANPPNPYLDPRAVAAEEAYIASVVTRFSKVPWLSYDLINEPSFANPRLVFHGNVPNNDAAELAAWRGWLQQRYGSLTALADAWRVTPEQLAGWKAIPLPAQADLVYSRYGNDRQARAFDYNLFAQDMFSGWVQKMVGTIRAHGSEQLVNVGQDEGGVTNRVLNQFYATAGVSFTTNHTYWQDDALLWDSVVAKRPGMPNITGETGYQPAWDPDGTWRYDELTGEAIEERKLVLGFAAGSSGALQWDWAREVDFGVQRSDGSAKRWEAMLDGIGQFAGKAAPAATGFALPQVAIVLPQSLQLSTHNGQALQAQQAAVRILYQRNRVEAYAVGEYQTETLGKPKLIVLPSAYGLTEQAWKAIETRVREGAVLLASGPFGADEHLHATLREPSVGIPAALVALQQREQTLHTTFGELPLSYGSSLDITVLDRDLLPDGKDYLELPLGKGRLVYSAFPLELNGTDASTAKVYEHALHLAGVTHTYTTPVTDPGILICPTQLPHATLYAVSSETGTAAIRFTDVRSGKTFAGKLDAGRAALLLVDDRGTLVAQYGWKQAH